MRPCTLRPPDFVRPSVSAFSGSSLVTASCCNQVAKRRPGEVGLCFLIAMRCLRLLALEELDRIVGMQRHHGLLPLAPLPGGPAAPLRLRLDPCRAYPGHPHAEDLLDRLADLGLVRALVHAERVLVGREQGVALLGDHGAYDHVAGVHFATAFLVRRPSAASDTTSRSMPTTSATPTCSTCMTVTPAMFRNDLAQISSPSASTTSTLPWPSKPD